MYDPTKDPYSDEYEDPYENPDDPADDGEDVPPVDGDPDPKPVLAPPGYKPKPVRPVNPTDLSRPHQPEYYPDDPNNPPIPGPTPWFKPGVKPVAPPIPGMPGRLVNPLLRRV